MVRCHTLGRSSLRGCCGGAGLLCCCASGPRGLRRHGRHLQRQSRQKRPRALCSIVGPGPSVVCRQGGRFTPKDGYIVRSCLLCSWARRKFWPHRFASFSTDGFCRCCADAAGQGVSLLLGCRCPRSWVGLAGCPGPTKAKPYPKLCRSREATRRRRFEGALVRVVLFACFGWFWFVKEPGILAHLLLLWLLLREKVVPDFFCRILMPHQSLYAVGGAG